MCSLCEAGIGLIFTYFIICGDYSQLTLLKLLLRGVDCTEKSDYFCKFGL